jgi:hypothetical protein
VVGVPLAPVGTLHPASAGPVHSAAGSSGGLQQTWAQTPGGAGGLT